MRMGNTFSRALDPSKPLLFGDFPLDILEEEVWHSSARRLSWQSPLASLGSDFNADIFSKSNAEANSLSPGKEQHASGTPREHDT